MDRGVRRCGFNRRMSGMDHHCRSFVYMIVVSLVYGHFTRNSGPCATGRLSSSKRVPVHLAGHLLSRLRRIDLVRNFDTSTGSSVRRFMPTVSVGRLSINQLLSAVRDRKYRSFGVSRSGRFDGR